MKKKEYRFGFELGKTDQQTCTVHTGLLRQRLTDDFTGGYKSKKSRDVTRGPPSGTDLIPPHRPRAKLTTVRVEKYVSPRQRENQTSSKETDTTNGKTAGLRVQRCKISTWTNRRRRRVNQKKIEQEERAPTQPTRKGRIYIDNLEMRTI